ncbi:hypothetical protein NL676_017116 [Syzygium grande]|nr:hypothetical protein NL676_017116 [Syzygium grande]
MTTLTVAAKKENGGSGNLWDGEYVGEHTLEAQHLLVKKNPMSNLRSSFESRASLSESESNAFAGKSASSSSSLSSAVLSDEVVGGCSGAGTMRRRGSSRRRPAGGAAWSGCRIVARS